MSARELFAEAGKKNIAIGAFNFTNMEFVHAIVDAANESGSSVIFQASESALTYMGMDFVVGMMRAVSETVRVPVAFHLDHGKDFEICKKAISAGFSSVMIDKSQSSLAENIAYTQEVVEYAHKKGVSVEAELGTLSGIEDDIDISIKDAVYTNPESAQEFVEKTGVDSLAVAIGTSHGAQKGKIGSPKLDIQRLIEIHEKTNGIPLVLHGASSVAIEHVDLCNIHGAKIQNAFGINDEDIFDAIRNGVRKINIDTDLRIAFLAGMRRSLAENSSAIDVRKFLGDGKKLVREVVMQKIQMFARHEV